MDLELESMRFTICLPRSWRSSCVELYVLGSASGCSTYLQVSISNYRWSLGIVSWNAETLWKCGQIGVRPRLNMHELMDSTRKPMCLYRLPDYSLMHDPCRRHRDKWRKDNGNLLEHHLGCKAHAQDLQVGTKILRHSPLEFLGCNWQNWKVFFRQATLMTLAYKRISSPCTGACRTNSLKKSSSGNRKESSDKMGRRLHRCNLAIWRRTSATWGHKKQPLLHTISAASAMSGMASPSIITRGDVHRLLRRSSLPRMLYKMYAVAAASM